MSALKLACPSCGTLMNHHADKVDYGVSLNISSAVNMEFDGVLQEIHYCPECGETAVQNV